MSRERLADAALSVALLGAMAYFVALAALHLLGIE